VRKKVLVVLTNGRGEDLEPFLLNELCHYGIYFDEVIIFPVSGFGHEYHINNIVVYPINLKRISRSKSIESIFSTSLLNELFFILRSFKQIPKKIQQLITFIGLGKTVYNSVTNILIKRFNDPSNFKFVFYSYWLTESAFAAVLLAKRFPDSIAVSRCHGYDLYEYRQRSNYLPMRRFLLNFLTGVYSISLDGYQYLKNRYPGYNQKLNVAYLGTLEKGKGIYSSIKSPLKLVSCSAVVPLKRLNKIIESLKYLTEFDVHWTHLGDGPDLEEIKRLSASLPKNITTKFLGRLSPDKIYEFYIENECHLFLNVSEFEGIPVSIMEATSFGIPVIATDVGGTIESVVNGTSGYLINKNFEPSELASIIKSVFNLDNVKYGDLRVQSRKIWESKFSAESNFSSFFKELSLKI
jgi:glycosyltransferase involved in cell wall biosynthesis